MKKSLCVFLSLIMMLSLIPMAVLASDVIGTVVVLGIDEPVDGAYYDRFASLPSNVKYTIFNEPEWYDETDKRFLEEGDSFESGHIYTVSVWLEPSNGYEFASTATTTDVAASINGKTAKADKAFEYQRWAMVVVSYTFPAVEKAKPAREVTIEIAKPKPGEKASFDAKLTGEGIKLMERIPDLASVYQYAIRGVQWEDRTINHKMSEGETFTTGHEYGLSVFIEPEDGYKLDDSHESYAVSINGSNPTAIDGFGEDRRGYYISYDCIDQVGNVNFNAVEPEASIAPYFDVIPISPSVERNVSNILYYDMSTREHIKTDTIFEEGHYYEVRFRATAKDGYEFSSDENGEVDVSKILVNEHPVTDAYYMSTWSKQYIEVLCVYDVLKKDEKPMPIQYDKDECIDGLVQYVKVYDVTPPKAGELPDQVGVTLSDCYRIPHLEAEKTAFKWINVTDNKDMAPEKDRFENGKEYAVHIGISTHYSFKTDETGKADFKGYINGQEVDAVILLDNELYDGDAVLVYNFGVLGGKQETPKEPEKEPEKTQETEKPTESEKPAQTEKPQETEKTTETEIPSKTDKPQKTEKNTIADNPQEIEKSPFVDVEKGQYYYAPVTWAVEEGITSGTSANTFSPDAICTRAQVVTFLHRMVASPEPAAIDMPFVDVKEDAFYYKPVKWAVGSKITGGTSANTFSPDDNCTRAQVVTFLWRTAGQPKPSGKNNPFADVKADSYYYNAVLWAVENGITGGTSATTFSPDNNCTRAQVVTFLYRFINS